MKKIIAIIIFSLNLQAFAGIQVKSIELEESRVTGTLRVDFTGMMDDYPEFEVKGDKLQLLLKNSSLKDSVSRNENLFGVKDSAMLTTTKQGKDLSILLELPFALEQKADKVSLTIKEQRVLLSFPRLEFTPQAPAISKKDLLKESASVTKDMLNEDYLKALAAPKLAAKVDSTKKLTPTVSKKAGPITPKTKQGFSFSHYLLKIAGFLLLIVMCFYGIVIVLKKGFIKKGRLGFLNNTEQVSVLSQTHIAPNKSLMLIQAHNQVFLVSNTQAGIHPISEIKDVSGLIKGGEKIIAGDNFDDSLALSETKPSALKLKENILESQGDRTAKSKKSRFSDQIKKKIQDLKPLQ